MTGPYHRFDDADLLTPRSLVLPYPESRPAPAVVVDEIAFQPVLTVNKDLVPALRIYYQNVRGLRTKIDLVFLATAELDYDIYVFTETWLDDCIQSAQLFSSNYRVFRVDRCDTNSIRRRGGGVLIAVKQVYGSAAVRSSNVITIEQLWVKVSVVGGDILIGALYIPPDRSQDSSFVQLHFDAVSEVFRTQTGVITVVLLGDFNQPRLVWLETNNGEYASVDPSQSCINMASQVLLDNISFHALRQRNLIRNCSNRILDLIFSNGTLVSNGSVSVTREPIVPIDRYHPALIYSVECKPPVQYEEAYDFERLDFRRADYDALNQLLSQVDWSEVFQSLDVDSATNSFNHILMSCITQTVPRSRPPRNPAWSNDRLRTLRKRRVKFWNLFCRQRCPILKRQFNETSRIYRGYNRFLYKRYVKRRQDDLRRNPKRFWSFVNSKRKKFGLPTVMHLGDSSVKTPQAKCDLFARHFKSVFVDNSLSRKFGATKNLHMQFHSTPTVQRCVPRDLPPSPSIITGQRAPTDDSGIQQTQSLSLDLKCGGGCAHAPPLFGCNH
ncbi:uncharacterized protein LOC129762742 [Toxorhynchites rutilus septentrionalis]|uniref:uncharacterized protein LOC129762742 n=1 Tax=Toxorhynchites rutilus septentrionalis TaxID=329112 RepID=UPI002479F7EB|nr:uncharacterized protein LOC129762742 [Toxorhynchites rutilus septentrionalis]